MFHIFIIFLEIKLENIDLFKKIKILLNFYLTITSILVNSFVS